VNLAEASRTLAELEALAAQVEADPSAWMAWLPGQHAFLSNPSRVKLFRAGNQSLGKTTAGLSEVHFRALGAHPFQEVAEPPIEAWILCASWSQSLAIQGKFHAIAQAHLVEDTRFCSVNGYHANRPTARYRNGSIVRFKTTQQSGLDLAGATIDVALFDEPPASPRIFEEVRKRLIRGKGGGCLLLCLTPINAPTDWLRELVEAGQIADIHRPLTAEELVPVGESEPLRLPSGQPMNQAWIDELRANTLPYAVPVVIDGEWEQRVVGRVFTAWDETTMVRGDAPYGGTWKVCLGIDHGSKVGKEVALLVLVDEAGEQGHDRIWVVDEYVGAENGSVSDDARGILALLARNSIQWKQLDYAYGDRLYLRGAVDRKSNIDLVREIARLVSVPHRSLSPMIRTVKRGKGRGRGSVNAGCRYLHQAMVRPGHFFVHPRCTRLLEALDRWDYSDSDFKDPLDALRYALTRYVFRTTRDAYKPQRLHLY